MPERTVKAVFYSYVDDDGRTQTASRGDTIKVSSEEAKRGDSLGAFEGSPEPERDGVSAHFGTATGRPDGVPDKPANDPGESDLDDELALAEAEIAELKAENDRLRGEGGGGGGKLTGDELEKAGEDAGHPSFDGKPWSELKADEKRAALKQE